MMGRVLGLRRWAGGREINRKGKRKEGRWGMRSGGGGGYECDKRKGEEGRRE